MRPKSLGRPKLLYFSVVLLILCASYWLFREAQVKEVTYRLMEFGLFR